MLDVSVYQGHIDWAKVRTAHQIVQVKACEGLYENDGMFHANVLGASAHGLIVGAYFFGHPHEDAKKQAAHFLNVAHSILRPGYGLPWLDLEITEGISDQALQEWCREWFSVVDPVIGKKSLLYTYSSFAPKFAGALLDHPLAIANYDGIPSGRVPTGAWPRAKVLIHQYTSGGSCPGVTGKVDLDYRFFSLRNYLITQKTTPTLGRRIAWSVSRPK